MMKNVSNLVLGILVVMMLNLTGCGGGGGGTTAPTAPIVTNSVPVANAGTAQSVVTGAVVTLDGSASIDANGDLLTYNWSFTSKPAGSSAALSSATVAKPTFTADVAGAYVLNLVVDDGKVNSAAGTVTITATTPSVPLTPNAKLPKTGQSKCYDTNGGIISCSGSGQDADYASGQSWPTPRYLTDNSTVIDNLTGLVWLNTANLIKQKNPEYDSDGVSGDGEVTWQNALNYISKLNTESYLGHNDWRMPNIKELESLIDYDNNAIASNNIANIPYSQTRIWSSTTSIGWKDMAWCLHTGYKYYVSEYKIKTGLVIPVRNSNSNNYSYLLPKTGQVTCYDSAGALIACAGTGQDGEIQAGYGWPAIRYVNNSDDTITDNLTGLVWDKNANHGKKLWQNALDYVKSLNTSNYLGHNDWRLPNIREILSLWNYNYADSSTYLNSNGFSGFQLFDYWSSTTYFGDETKAWNALSYGGNYDISKTFTYTVIPVRLGN